jgi:N-carbamoylputrescine amidase
MTTIVRAALTETRNAYHPMPTSLAELSGLSGSLEAIRAKNVAHHVELIRRAARDDVHVLCLGELFTGPYFALHRDPMWFELAEDARAGPTITTLREVAREVEMILIAPLYELDPDSRTRFNTAVVIDERGELLGKYRKTHIPSGTNECASFCEDFYYGPSDGRLDDTPANNSKNPFFPVFQTRVGRIGISTCYDRHFPGVARSLAAEGAQIVFSPAVTFGEKSRRMWELEFLVDAARHNLFIGGSNRKGNEPPFDVEYFGASYFCSPGGRLANRSQHEELVIADLDLDELSAEDPSGWDFARDTRPEIYGG